jgi:YgiT-type zinc finger domain-containing protein
MSTQGPSQCPRCGGDLDRGREEDRTVREGNDVALVTVMVDRCVRCGEVLLHPGMVEKLANAREALRRGEQGSPIGSVYDLRSSRSSHAGGA